MLETTQDSFNLKDLERRLEQRLRAEFPKVEPLQVACSIRGKTLVILVHLPELVIPSAKDLLSQLKQILHEEETILSYPIEFHLKIDGRGQLESVTPPEGTTQIVPGKPLGIGFGLLLALGSFYGLSRPCVFGTCPNLTQAETSARTAVNSVSLSASTQDIQRARQQLDRSSQLLAQIPPWSGYHAQAGRLLNIVQQHSNSLDDLSQALHHASKAVSSANSPLATAQWQIVRTQWEQAISFLKELPSNSPYYPYAQLKLRQYQENLTLIDRRLQAERQAGDRIRTAQQTAQIALIRQNAARSLVDWRLVEATWQTAIELLQGIPSGTAATREAQNLIQTYTVQLVNATARKTQEASSTQFYRQATQQAALAQKEADRQQWSSALTAWRKAITALKQIPADTFQYKQAQPLISSYLLSLNQAETNLQAAIKLQSLRQDLETICKIPQKVCDYQISQALIKVNLTETYVHQVWYTAVQAKAQTSIPTQVSLLNHIAKLEKSLQTISDRSQKKVEVYNPEQNIIAIYEPDRQAVPN